MSLPTLEIVHKRATEAFRANPKDASLVKPAFDILSAQKGQLQKYYGVEHEDKETAYAVIAWEELEDHYKLMNDKETYPRLREATKGFFDASQPGKEAMLHVRPTSEPYKAFEAPVTEIAYFTAKEGKSKSEIEELVDALAKAMNAAGQSEGVFHAAWGPSVEKDNVVVLFIGWTNVEAHWNAVQTNKTLSEIVAKCRATADVHLIHVAFTKA
ncbi:hypothetical protein BV20DRAFT_963120 [Pilatotrama ljubarskyi]|nr:hypothetical protein BV20DRAFT_963120 [Pilatotrama ljubarskyi]